MMTPRYLILLLLLGGASAVFGEGVGTFGEGASHLRRSCLPAVDIMDRPIGVASGEDLARGAYCVGVVLGALRTIGTLRTLDDLNEVPSSAASGFCFPDGVTPEQLARVFLKYVDKHPEQLHQDWDKVLLLSWAEVFACKESE